ncbi:chromatin modification-related protein vid21-like [Lycium ferocissimum]|uniref:chromatin modification-related protein vid21-like n=1 Tax=Lycium ferocissimum TaxID=112874 RepID=UPI002814EBE5|nr:chromatin modification-related protein vid21-like [Lycium ferocissimum]
MGACASKPKVLEGTAPGNEKSDLAREDMKNNNKEEGIVGDDVANKPHSLSNLFKENEEGKGPEQVKEETSQTTQASESQPEEIEKAADAHIKTEIEEVVSKTETPQAQTFLEKTTDKIKSEEEVIKPETETPMEKKVEELKETVETPTEKKVEEVKETMETPTEKKVEEVKETVEITQEEKKIEENSETKSEAPVEKKMEEKPVMEAKKPVIEEKKSGKFWWDK